jgi:ATP-dependent DNA helicase RecG
MGEKLTPLLQAVAEHGGTELELKYNDFFTPTSRASAQVTGQVTGQVAGQVAGQVGTRSGPSRDQVGTRQSHGQSHGQSYGQSHRGIKSFSCLKKSQSRQQKYRLTNKWDTMLRQESSHE